MTEYAIGAESLPGLSKLIEEMGEVQQQIGRLIQCRFLKQRLHWDGSDPYEELVNELADLQAAIQFVIFQGMANVDYEAFTQRSLVKYQTFKQWAEEQREKTKK